MSTITLFMIVKNESKIIQRCLHSLKDIVDYIVITDTGSTDNTIEQIESFFETHHIKGKVFQNEWKNFGHNRTLSFQNAQQWMIEQQIDLSTNFSLTIDADMCLVFTCPIQKDKLNQSDVWTIKQKNNVIEYYNSRIFKSSLPHVCVGVTHEYWSCPQPNIQTKPFNDFYIDDRGDGGAKDDKFTRDIRLLTQGIKDEPNNDRYHFYLANSYLDNEDFQNAIEYYKKRIQFGGWPEELFMCYHNLGKAYLKLDQKENAIESWLLGYNTLPKRSETLYRLANYYRLNGLHPLSLLFIKTGIKIPFPTDLVLFIQYNVYSYLFIEELSIIAYYVNLKKEGLLACQYLILYLYEQKHTRQLALSNTLFYLQPLCKEKRIHNRLSFPTKEPFISSSSCLDLHKNQITGIVRAVNYSMDHNFNYTSRHPEGIVQTINYWVEMDLKYNCNTFYEIDWKTQPIPKHQTRVMGLEDVRFTFFNKKVYAIAVDREHCEHSHPSILFLCLQKNNKNQYEIVSSIPIPYKNEITQKNWTIFCDKKLYLCYSHHPFTLLEVNPENGEYKVVVEKYSSINLSNIRGSSNPIFIKEHNEWLFLVHEVGFQNTRKYYHRFIKYDTHWNLINISEPFYFNELYVEFSLSIMYDKNKIIIPFSSKDNTTEIIRIEYSDLPWIPQNLSNYLKEIL